MHAESPHEDAAVRLNHTQCVCGQFAAQFAVALCEGNEVIFAQWLCRQILGSAGLVERKIVHDLTGGSASSTTDATSCVNENGFAHFFNISNKWQVGQNSCDKSPTRKICMHAMCREIHQFRLAKVL
jgi:hypothetical protein